MNAPRDRTGARGREHQDAAERYPGRCRKLLVFQLETARNASLDATLLLAPSEGHARGDAMITDPGLDLDLTWRRQIERSVAGAASRCSVGCAAAAVPGGNGVSLSEDASALRKSADHPDKARITARSSAIPLRGSTHCLCGGQV